MSRPFQGEVLLILLFIPCVLREPQQLLSLLNLVMSQSDVVLLLLLITSLDRRQKCRPWVANLIEAVNPIPNSSCHQGLSDTYNMPLGSPRRSSAKNNSEAQLPCVRLGMG